MNMIENPKQAPGECPDPNEHPDRDDKLDEAVADSMIASDPPASVSKGQPTAPPRQPKNVDANKRQPADADHSGKSGGG